MSLGNWNTCWFDGSGNAGAACSRCGWGRWNRSRANREVVWRHRYCRCEVVDTFKHVVSVFDSICFDRAICHAEVLKRFSI